jgi:hypothetical protein
MQKQNIQDFLADPGAMSQLLPPDAPPYTFLPTHSGLIIEHGLNARIQSHPVIGNILEHIPAAEQRVPGGRGDFRLQDPFAHWNLPEWDSTTEGQAWRKLLQGKDRTYITYSIDWSELAKKLGVRDRQRCEQTRCSSGVCESGYRSPVDCLPECSLPIVLALQDAYPRHLPNLRLNSQAPQRRSLCSLTVSFAARNREWRRSATGRPLPLSLPIDAAESRRSRWPA